MSPILDGRSVRITNHAEQRYVERRDSSRATDLRSMLSRSKPASENFIRRNKSKVRKVKSSGNAIFTFSDWIFIMEFSARSPLLITCYRDESSGASRAA